MKRLLLLFLLIPSLALAEPGTVRYSTASPTADTNIYATGEVIGGKLTFSNAMADTTGTGFLVSVRIIDQSAQASDLDLVIFSSNPTSTTFTDQAALDIADADLSKVIGVVNFGSSSRFAFADNGIKFVANQTIPIVSLTNNTTLYGVLVSRGTPTFAGATDLSVTLGLSPDRN